LTVVVWACGFVPIDFFFFVAFCDSPAGMLVDFGCLIVCGEVSERSEFGFYLTLFCLFVADRCGGCMYWHRTGFCLNLLD
jgi:hypothetical protein